ncbi:MAG: diguanylate cyclase [Spirochaetales bacterium]|nr:diguanylate cyclase [Spirochaetales bacterium]
MQSTYMYVPHLWLYIVSTVVLLMFMAAQLPRIHLPLARRILWVLFTAFLWNFFLILEFMVSTIELKLFYAKIQYIGIVWLPIAWLALVVELSSYRFSKWLFIVSSIPPIVFLIFIFLVPQPNVFWGIPTIETTSIFPMVNFHYGPLFYYGFLPFSYLMALISIIILWRNYGNNQPHYRLQKLLITFVLLLPGLTNLLYNFNISPIKGLNLSTATLTISGVFFYIILYRNFLLDLVPVTREQIVENLDEAVLIFNSQNRLIDFNHSAATLFYLGRNSIGISVDELGIAELTQCVENPQNADSKIHVHIQGLVYDISLSFVLDHNSEFCQAIIVTLRDITQEQLLNQQLQILAQRDSLTGLYNRHTFFFRSKELIHANPTLRIAAIMIDLDNFKAINDTYGHAYGDLILQTMGEALLTLTSPSIIAGRLGGDEFVVMTTEQDLSGLASRLSNKIYDRLHIVAKEGLNPTLSIGISSINLAICSVEDPLEYLLNQADLAMYQAKNLGKDKIVFAGDLVSV